MNAKKTMLFLTLIFFIGWLGFGAVYCLTNNQVLYAMLITCGTVFYHFAMRLTVGYLIDAKFHNHMDYTKKWFQERGFEYRFYKKIQVQKWKKRLPSFQPSAFRLQQHSAIEILEATCQAEIIHEIIMALSFVPVLFSVWFGAAGVFAVTSFLAFLLDGVFVVLQRYNRPRLLRYIKKTGKHIR